MPAPRHHIRVRDRRSGATSDHRFTATSIRIGRDPASDLHLADPFVSHEHAILECDEHGAILRDLGGANGLRISGRRLAPHAVIRLDNDARLRVSLGPFDLEISHTADRDHQAASGALDEPGPTALAGLHTRLRQLHALHAPHVAARQAFESALAEAIHAADDPAVARRILAEFPTSDHLLLARQSPHLSLEPSHDISTPGEPAPLPSTSPPAAPQAVTRLATAAHALLPNHRPPASLDEADHFLARLVATTRALAAGLGALQHLRLRQARDLGVTPTDQANPLLTLTDADDLLAALLDWRSADADRTPELLDCFTVLAAHARAHVDATLAATRHLAAVLAPATIDQHAPPGLLRSRARWHTFLDRHAALLGDDTTPGTLRTSFRAAYLAELEHHGLAVTPIIKSK